MKGADDVAKAKRAGITHFPLSEEQGSQQQVPARGKRKKASGPATSSGTMRGQRESRRKGHAGASGRDGTFTAKGKKGGKAGGSHAGLKSSRKAAKGQR
jgi:hypothetical protein